MCGIGGIISLSDNNVAIEEQIVKLCDLISHRGEDGEGFLFTHHFENYANKVASERENAFVSISKSNRRVALGHRRLSILDLSTLASQPMSDHSGRYWIVFNGEIYNHKYLRVELQNLGYTFVTDHSDTEVIIESYKAWGIDCLQKFNGMFAFCIWDIPSDFFFLVRDRLGIKPLYWTVYNRNFYFSSESKAVIQSSGKSKELDTQYLMDYLSYSAVTAPGTLVQGVNKLPASYFMTIKNGEISEPKRYWSPFDYSGEKLHVEEEIIAKITEYLEESSEMQFAADVPVGIFLSGGLDSSAILSLLAPKFTTRLKSFSVGFGNNIPGYTNEFKYSSMVSKLYNTEHFIIELQPKEYLDALPEMIRFQDEPISNTAAIPIHFLSKLAKQNGVKVVLGGEGSDELLVGYQLWRFAQQFDRFTNKIPSFFYPMLRGMLRLPVLRHKRVFYQDWLQNKSESGLSLRGTNDLWQSIPLQQSLSKGLKTNHPNTNIAKYLQEFKKSDRKNTLDWLSYLDINFHLPELLLSRFDKMTMAAGVEGRVPFLDHRFVEFCFSIDANLKIENKIEKYLLKKAMKDKLPYELIHRVKDGFSIPMNNILKTGLKDMGMQSLKAFNFDNQIFDTKFVDTLFEKEKSTVIWNILNLAIWWENLKKLK